MDPSPADMSGQVSAEELSEAFLHVGLDKAQMYTLMADVTPTGTNITLEVRKIFLYYLLFPHNFVTALYFLYIYMEY